jgi:hypothetical protein
MTRDLFAREALAHIPKLLTLLDRNPHSPTYGCFDRNFWHYRILDFPSGMAQEFVWPLALVFASEIPGNPYYRQAQIREWAEAAILYAVRSAHPDGSCDDYFPYERAAGAAAFSLLACLESYQLLGLANQAVLAFFRRRADWLAAHDESGRLSNHQALTVLCWELAGRLLKTDCWESAINQRLHRLLSWQSEEGWFPEYEGCDPGYHTLTLSIIARLYQLRPTQALKLALIKAVSLTSELVHPDGSYGGEYGSRNTYNYFPHGLELVGRWHPEALGVNDAILKGFTYGRGACYADDHIIGHHVWNYLLAWRDFVTLRPGLPLPRSSRVFLREAGIIIIRREDTELYLALNKGGTFKFFREGKLVVSDTQISLRIRKGSHENTAVGHLVDRYDCAIGDDEIVISGTLGWAKQTQMTPPRLIALRLVMLVLGRFFPNLIRRLLQGMLITGKQVAPFTFRRSLCWGDGRWQVTDNLAAKSWAGVTGAGIGGDQTSIYVVMSRTFQAGQLQPWLDLTEQVKALGPGETLTLKRYL